jgi:hypothetical protein
MAKRYKAIKLSPSIAREQKLSFLSEKREREERMLQKREREKERE